MQDESPKNGQYKRIKVLFAITKGVWGGAQKYVYTLATNLPQDLYDVVVVCGEGNILKEKLDSAGIKTHTIENLQRDISIKKEVKSFFELFKIIKRESPDVLHLNSPKAGGLGALIGRLLFVPTIIYTVHGWTFNEQRNLWNKALIRIFSVITLTLCHKTIVIAKKEERQAFSLPLVNHNKIKLIRNGIDKIDFKKKSVAREELASIAKIDTIKGHVWFGCIAELHTNKGLEYAIRAVSKLSNHSLFFIIGEGEKRKELEDLIIKLNIQDRVFLVGFLENANLYLNAFDIFILTSIKEGLPYTILEAGLAGLPVVATSVGGIPEIIENNVSGLLVNRTVKDIETALSYLMEHPDTQEDLGKNLKKTVKEKFSLKQMLSETEELYRGE